MNASPALILSLVILRFAISPGHSGLPAMPMPVDETATADYRWRQKPVIESRLLHKMETTQNLAHRGFGAMSLTTERCRDGQHSVRLISPTKSPEPPRTKGRPFGEAAVRLAVPDEDWRAFNRISFWVYPHAPGFKVMSLLVKFHNQGDTRVPDQYNREGLDYVIVRNGQWNHVVSEIAHLARDKVSGVELIYRLQGHEPGATNQVAFDFDRLELQRVSADYFEGWEVKPGGLAYSHSGYLPDVPKLAFATGLEAREFTVHSVSENRTVLRQPVNTAKTETGTFQILDFSQITNTGEYRLRAGAVETPSFRIGPDAWRSSIVKTINFFYCERCGDKVSGIHEVCHQDWQATHGGRTITINGGWHDAGDLSQGVVNTSESMFAMLDLAEALRDSDPEVSRRLMEEAAWGLQWLLKTRFGDGYRVTWATMDYWTDGKLGSVDDTFGDVRNSPFENFLAAAAEAKAARWLQGRGAIVVEHARQAAIEDWQFAVEQTKSPALELAAAGAFAGVELFRLTQNAQYLQKAAEYAETILNSQQRQRTDWTTPLCGFFYTSPRQDRILHYAHRGHEQAPTVALAGLCELLPDHPDWMKWYSAVFLHSEYLRKISEFTAPYAMLPASVYSIDESGDARFKEQVQQGLKLSDKHYLRRFPVWFDFRGNHGTVLSQTKALTAAARLRRDRDLLMLAHKQLEWVMGSNPFCQSTMYGEGHDYAPQYSAMSGDLVGSLPVGIQTRENLDLPYWPAANCYNYKEVWVHPSARWLSIQSDLARPLDASAAGDAVIIGLGRIEQKEDSVRIELAVRGRGQHELKLRASNLAIDKAEVSVILGRNRTVVVPWEARIIDPREPWVAVAVADDKIEWRREIAHQ